MKLSMLYESGGHWDIIADHPGLLGGSKKAKKDVHPGVPKQWQKSFKGKANYTEMTPAGLPDEKKKVVRD